MEVAITISFARITAARVPLPVVALRVGIDAVGGSSGGPVAG
jgi:hypothetical protein